VCAWVKEIQISVVTAGRLRGSDKQPTVRKDGRGIALKQTLTGCLYTQADRKQQRGWRGADGYEIH
jgi:hypothetical protein